MDISSAKGFFTSIKNSSKNQNQPLATPSSFLPPPPSGVQKKQFAPPPVRRVTPDFPSTSTASTPTPPVPPPPPRRKEEPVGEWAEVLYDFTGDVSVDVFPCKWLAPQLTFPLATWRSRCQGITARSYCGEIFRGLVRTPVNHRDLALLICCVGGQPSSMENKALSPLPTLGFCEGSYDSVCPYFHLVPRACFSDFFHCPMLQALLLGFDYSHSSVPIL